MWCGEGGGEVLRLDVADANVAVDDRVGVTDGIGCRVGHGVENEVATQIWRDVDRTLGEPFQAQCTEDCTVVGFDDFDSCNHVGIKSFEGVEQWLDSRGVECG